MRIKYKIILLKNLETYLKKHPDKHESLDQFVSRLVIEENNLFDQYNIKSIKDLWDMDPPRLSTMESLLYDSKQRDAPLIGFIFLSYFTGSNDIITFGIIEKMDISEIFPTEEKSNKEERNYLLQGIGVHYKYRQRGLCKNMVKIMINKCKELFDYGRIYLESVSHISNKCYLASGFTVITYYKTSHTDTVLALDF
jgi:hypothetical protein